jgi:chromate transporter
VPEGFYRAGSLVFGGGHVVLPLLDAFTVGQDWVDRDTFLAGYGAAQALPGPLFAFSGFLGAAISAGPGGITGGVLALTVTFVPSWLLVLGVLPYWDRLRRLPTAQAALLGTNAAVVGLLLAAFYDPIWLVAVTDAHRLAFAGVAFALLRYAAVPPWLLVLISAGGGALLF